MSSQEIKIGPKQLLAFLLLIAVATIGILFFFIKSSDQKTLGSSTSLESGDSPSPTAVPNRGFLGEKGSSVEAVDGQILISESDVSDGDLHPFNFYSEKAAKSLYFFIVKASDGTYRAAANACEVCFGSQKGFRQVGELIRCENCRVTYSKDQIALQKGGCNPRPISRNVEVINGQLVLDPADIEKTADLF
jgi:hypothetical protein